jgi:hypothetical protein
MKIKRSYSDFKSIAASKSLQIIQGDIRSDYYHLLALDGQITYEANVLKDGGADQVDFEANVLPGITVRVTENPDWDLMTSSFPSSVTELQTYRKNGITVQTILITYTNSSKNFISSIQKTRV